LTGQILDTEHSIISQLDTQQQSLVLKLCQLPCFTQHKIVDIRVINLGLSQPCFEIQCDHKNYFAKHIVASSVEPLASLLAASHYISPTPLYVGHNWLVTEFIEGKELKQCQQSEEEKLTVMLTLLARCHCITYDLGNKQYIVEEVMPHPTQQSLPKLDIAAIIWQLLQNNALSASQEQVLTPLLALLQQNLANTNEKLPNIKQVFCHGDANFSNVIQRKNNIKNKSNLYQLIDFECACIAPIEYDLAMLMAVNDIDYRKIEMINLCYQQALISLNQSENTLKIDGNLTNKVPELVGISMELITRYLDLSFLINGLWYFSQYQARKQLKYKTLAIKQLKALAIRHPQTNLVLDEMR